MTEATQRNTRARQASILVVDDDPSVHRLLEDKLGAEHYRVHAASNAGDALTAASRSDFDIILLDVDLPDASGLDALRRLRSQAVPAGVVMISGEQDSSSVVEAMRLGALDFLVKPLHPDKVLATVALAARAGRLERENRRLADRLRETDIGTELVGCSPPLRRLADVLRRVAQSDATVLIEGKPGSGKTLCAELVHRSGRRSHLPFVSLAADSSTPESLEASLTEAHGGTLLLEDVDLMPAPAQSRLVRHLKERGGRADVSQLDVRIIATSSARLPELVAKGKLREDLYYRLNVFPIQVPSLQERRDDVALLATHFLRTSAEAAGSPQKGFTASAMILLETNPWPGNVAQLQNAVMRAQALAGGEPVDTVHLLGPSTGITADSVATTSPNPSRPNDEDDEEVREEDILPFDAEEKRLLARALKATKGNVRRAAQLLRIGRATLYRKIQVYKLRLH